MSRNLPAQPNLEHLKKQAKDLLEDLQRRNPDAKLADALHEVAREYGFATWPQLKEHVLAVRPLASAHPLAGSWVADVSRSRRHSANQFRSARMHFGIQGNTVTVRDLTVDESGRSMEHAHTIEADGIEHETPNGYGLLAQWVGSHVLETQATKHGAVVGRGRYEVNADGETLTITADGQRIVCRRA